LQQALPNRRGLLFLENGILKYRPNWNLKKQPRKAAFIAYGFINVIYFSGNLETFQGKALCQSNVRFPALGI
jgi:hypothetical protein